MHLTPRRGLTAVAAVAVAAMMALSAASSQAAVQDVSSFSEPQSGLSSVTDPQSGQSDRESTPIPSSSAEPSAAPSTDAPSTEDETSSLQTQVQRDSLAESGDMFSCQPGTFYTITSGGQIGRVTSSGDSVDSQVGEVSQVGRVGYGTFNGLAVGRDGSTAFAFDRGSGDNQVMVYTSESGGAFQAVTPLTTLYTDPAGGGPAFATSNRLIAGGVSPVDSSGAYYFGGYSVTNRGNGRDSYTIEFHLWRMDASTHAITYVGHVAVASGRSTSGANGDLAFSASGDLYILWSDGDTNLRIIPVTAESLAAANGGAISGQDTPILSGTPAGNINGIAFNSDGRVLVQSSNGALTTAWLMDPDSGQAVVGSTTTLVGLSGTGVDLASCNQPPTLELRKDIVSRSGADDQFRLQIFPEDSATASASATTTGDSLGVQDQIAGPVVAVVGQTYRLVESGAGGAGMDLSMYDSSLVCRNTAADDAVVSTTRVSDTEYTVTIPPVSSGSATAISCTFTNTAIEGSVTWHKTDETGDALAGSTWTLTPTNPSGEAIEVVDNTGSAGGDGHDEDEMPGGFLVTDLLPGDWTLQETAAPDGYVVSSDVHAIHIDSDERVIDLGDLINRSITGSVTWSKTDQDGTALAGSQWSITPTDPTRDAIGVTDCVADEASACSGPDADPRAGVLTVASLVYGSYELRETSAPVGFVLDDAAHPFDIDENGATVTIDGSPFVNARAIPPTLPLTGGTSTDAFLLGGGGLVLLSGLAGFLAHWRRNRSDTVPPHAASRGAH